MKKSEMLNEIANIIHTYRRNTGATTSDDIAHMVLAKMEELGMLPPIEPDRRVEDLDLGIPEWENESAIDQAGAYLGRIANKKIIEALENDLNNPDLWDEDGNRK